VWTVGLGLSLARTDPTAEGVRIGCPGDACTVTCHDAGDKDGDHGPSAIPVGSQPSLVRVLCSRSSRSTLLLALNGEIMGTVADAADLVVNIRGLTILHTLPLHLTPSIYVGACGHVYIHIDDGRIIRPLLRWPTDIKCAPLKVDSLLSEGWLRYLDAAESSTHDICMDPCNPDTDRTYTMSEIHAILMLGITAGCIPLLHCPDASERAPNASASATNHPAMPVQRPTEKKSVGVCGHQTSMGRQSVGAPLPPGPFDLSPALCYAQRPLCTAALPDSAMEATESANPMGQNLVIAVCPYGGCNRFCVPLCTVYRGTDPQNDSIVLNAQSLQRGIGVNLAFHTTRFVHRVSFLVHRSPVCVTCIPHTAW
jgi:hypothetical protein